MTELIMTILKLFTSKDAGNDNKFSKRLKDKNACNQQQKLFN